MVTNFSFVLTNDSVAPVVLVGYPNDGMTVADGSVTLSGLLDDASAAITATLVSTNATTNTYTGLIERDGKFWIENVLLAGGSNWITLRATDAWGNSSTTNFVVVKIDFDLSINPLSDEQLTQTETSVSGTVGDPSFSVWVNGVEAVVNPDGSWSAENVPVTEGGTASFVISAYPPEQLQASGASGGGGASGAAAASSASSSNSVNANTNQVKNSHIKVLDYHNDFSSELSPRNQSPRGLWYSESHLNWALNKQATRHAIHIYQTNVSGGNQTITSDTTWPADDYAPTKAGTTVNVPGGITYNVPAPVIGQEHCEVSGKFPTFGFSLTNIYSRSAQTTMQLFTGGKALPKRDNLFVVRGSATRILTETAQPPYPPGTETEPIQDKTKITMGELGQLDATGVVWAVLPNGVTKDVTPKVSGVDFYAFGADHTKCVLTNICERGAPRPADRTDLGVGEYVSVYFTPSPAGIQIDWTTTAGSVTPASGSGTRFTAPSNAMSATVTASVKGLKCPVTFNVEKPTGVSAVITSTTANAIPSGIAGAWMHLDVTVQPTNVSFYRIEMIEIGQAATSISGYFEDHPPKPHDTAAGANTWHPVGESNLIGDSMDNCGYWGTGNLPSPYRPGSFTWPIPARWRIPGGPTNNFTWSDQVFSIDGSGTFSVSKFGQTVTRTINNVITPNL